MSAKFLHIGIPITGKKPNMTYVESLKIWMSNPDDHDLKIEYLHFEEGTPFPEIMHKNSHVAYQVDDVESYLAQADQIIFGPVTMDGGGRMAFIILHETIIELIEKG